MESVFARRFSYTARTANDLKKLESQSSDQVFLDS